MTPSNEFAADDSTARDLYELWGRREVRSHRRPGPLTRRGLTSRRLVAPLLALAAVAGVATAGGPGPDTGPGETGTSWTLAAPVPVETTATPAPEVLTEDSGRSEEAGASRRERTGTPARRWVTPLARTVATLCWGRRGGTPHRGVDLDAETGDEVRSVGNGVVVQAGRRYRNAGVTVVVDHGDALVAYAHLDREDVSVGQDVSAGERLGAAGATGNATGSHLHVGVSRTGVLSQLWDRWVDPVPWLAARGVSVAGCPGGA